MIVSVVYSLTGEQELVKHLAVQSIHNALLCGFYLRDDKPELVDEFLPNYRKELDALERDGLEFQGKRYKIELCGTADYKFLRGVAGIQDGDPSCGCGTCLCHKSKYELTLEQHQAALEACDSEEEEEGVVRLHDLTQRDAKLTGRLNHDPEEEAYICPACRETIEPGHVEDRSVDGGSFPSKDARDEQCRGHFSVCRSWFYTGIVGWKLIMDLLHNKLRIVPQLYYWTVAAPLNGQADRQLEVSTIPPCF